MTAPPFNILAQVKQPCTFHAKEGLEFLNPVALLRILSLQDPAPNQVQLSLSLEHCQTLD